MASNNGAAPPTPPTKTTKSPVPVFKDHAASNGEQVKDLYQSVAKLHGDTRYADLTIRCGERHWKMHKVIVCSRCKFFEKACDGRFKEAAGNVVTLPDDPPNAVAAMLQYLYTAAYDDSSDQEGCAPLVFNFRVHIVADKYDLPGLVALAEHKFKSRVDSGRFGIIEIVDAVREAYKFESDPQKPLRQHIMGHLMGPGHHLLRDDAFIQVAKGVPAFSAQLVSEILSRPIPPGYVKVDARFEAYRSLASALALTAEGIMTKRPGG
ncbi:hypothetical protein AC578_3189 [Pseudocercospora eumusae]|uniref:BTB domain-containing protein n=1 Tax=Pseudocercospora eumusae TaxID=321146 RepID=A0A139H5R6_9PEZI|nr:hypothetical protein AC578_3189 [Pseudocercospora eumusae]